MPKKPLADKLGLIQLSLDLRALPSGDMQQQHRGLHQALKSLFGLPDFYGHNFHALVDCLSELRQAEPADSMTRFNLQADEAICLCLKGATALHADLRHSLLLAVEAINQQCLAQHQRPSLYLLLA